MRGILAKIYDWISHPLYSQANTMDWAAGLVLILIASFLWKQVVDQLAE